MDRQRTMIIAAVTLGAVAASTAAVLGVPAMGSAVPVEQPVSAQSVGTPASLYGTSVVLPEGIAAFSLDEAGLVSVGDAGSLNQATLDGIEQQLADAPPQSVVYVHADSYREDGLTTALATVTPTNGLTLGSTNEAIGQWLAGVFPDTDGTLASLPVPNVPNASFSYTESSDEITWYVTEYVFQYADATVSVRLSTVDDGAGTRAGFDQMLAGMTR